MRSCEQQNLKKNNVFFCTKTPRTGRISLIRNLVSMSKKGNNFQLWKFVVHWLKREDFPNTVGITLCRNRIEAFNTVEINLLLWYSEYSVSGSRSQKLAPSSYQHTKPLETLLTSTCLRSEISAESFPKLNNVPLLYEAMYNYNKIRQSAQDPTKLAVHSRLLPEVDLISNCVDNF